MAATRKKGWDSAASAAGVGIGDRDRIYKEKRKIEWASHPLNDRVQLGYLLTKKDDGVKVTCVLVRIPKGETIPEHTHTVHDIIFPLSGKAKISIQGLGELELKKGVLVCVPPGVVHKVYDVTEDLEVYDVFSDATV
jgi:quercetin dioxygenase-like cupin family protein